MIFLADENFPIASILLLRVHQLEIVSVSETHAGSSDENLLRIACNKKHIILTFDKDFGMLIYHKHLPSPSGLVYFRDVPSYPDEPAEWLIHLLNVKNIFLEKKFTVLQELRVRQRPLP